MRRPIVLASLMLFTVSAHGELVITEIMYKPTTPPRLGPEATEDEPGADRPAGPIHTEWVEIHHTGEEPIEMAGYHLADGDGQTAGLPKGTVILPGQTVVLIPAACPVAEFHQAWGEDVTVWQLEMWGPDGLDGLDENPSKTNEHLELRDAKGKTIDAVPYQDKGSWPREAPPGPSIYLLLAGFTPIDNDAGANWARSAPGVDGARTSEKTELFTGQDIGSPGVVPLKIDEEKPVPLPNGD